MAGEQKNFAGAAVATKLTSPISEEEDVTIAVESDAGYPTGTSYPHVIVVDRGNDAEEKILVKRTSSNQFTAFERGYDSTTAVSHQADATVEHILDADTITRLVQHVFNETPGDHDARYRRAGEQINNADISGLAGSKVQGPVGQAATSDAATNASNLTRAWQTFTPAINGWELNDGTLECFRFDSGDLVHVIFKLIVGPTTNIGNTQLNVGLPVGNAFPMRAGAQGIIRKPGVHIRPINIEIHASTFGLYAMTDREFNSNVQDNVGLLDGSPWTWAPDDTVQASFFYPKAIPA